MAGSENSRRKKYEMHRAPDTDYQGAALYPHCCLVFTQTACGAAPILPVFTKNARPAFPKIALQAALILPVFPDAPALYSLCCRFCCRSPPRQWRNAVILPWLTLLVDSQRAKRNALIGQKSGKRSAFYPLGFTLERLAWWSIAADLPRYAALNCPAMSRKDGRALLPVQPGALWGCRALSQKTIARCCAKIRRYPPVETYQACPCLPWL